MNVAQRIDLAGWFYRHLAGFRGMLQNTNGAKPTYRAVRHMAMQRLGFSVSEDDIRELAKVCEIQFGEEFSRKNFSGKSTVSEDSNERDKMNEKNEKNEGRDTNKLTNIELIKLSQWYAPLLPEFVSTRPTREKVAEQATKDLGFPVTASNLVSVREGIGDWEVRAPRVSRRSKGENLRTVARILIRFMREAGYKPSRDDTEELERITGMSFEKPDKSDK